MKTLYLECRMGASGDMLMGALSELVDQQTFVKTMNALSLPGITLQAIPSEKCGIHCTHMEVLVDGEEEMEHSHHHHHGMHLSDVYQIIHDLPVSDKVKKDAENVYKLIADAESSVHHESIDNIHFHEVGSLDAVADVVGCCMLFDEIKAERIYASPVATGYGTVHCAHGILPVPAPATAYLLQDIPTYAGNTEGELCTPTGAALLKYFVNKFQNQPVMTVQKTGYGAGTKDFHEANILRAFLGESEEDGEISELVCNLDDMSGEDIGYASEALFKAGALDVYTTPVQMKKNRPGIVFTCMCRINDTDKMLSLMFEHLTTLGIREYHCKRHALKRSIETMDTPYGTVHVKKSEGYGVIRRKAEYEDLKRIAEENNISIMELRKKIKGADSE